MDSIPELRLLISEIDGVFAECGNAPLEATALRSKLTMWSRALLDSLPDFMQSALLLSRGSDTHFQVCEGCSVLMFGSRLLPLSLPPSTSLRLPSFLPPSHLLHYSIFTSLYLSQTISRFSLSTLPPCFSSSSFCRFHRQRPRDSSLTS